MERVARPHEEDTGWQGLWGDTAHPKGKACPPTPAAQERDSQWSRGARLGGETSSGSCHWKPLFLAAPPQLVLITLTGSRACCGGAPSPPQSRPCRQTSPCFPLPARLGCARGARLHPTPPARRPAMAFLLLPGSLRAPPGPALLPGIVRAAFNTSKPTLPVPSNVEPRPAGFYVCRAFGKQNA